jgi:hypothetical protein
LSFEPNLGQTDRDVGFLARGSGYRMLVRPEGVGLELSEGASARIVFANADPDVRIEPLDKLSAKVHYLVGDRPDRWLTGIPTFGGVVYRQLYPGIDLSFGGERRRLDLRFEIAAGTDVEAALIDLEGAGGIELDGSGDLVLRIGETAWRLTRPVLTVG